VSRIKPLPYDQWDPDTFSVLPRLRPNNVLGLLARHPALAKSFLTYNMHLLGPTSTLPPRIRELAILRMTWRRNCGYEWTHHVRIAAKAGVTDEEIAQIRDGAPTLINTAVDELDTTSRLSDQTYRQLAADLDDRQLMDLVFTVGTYGLLAMAFNTFEVELEEGT
jgi:alkylhydroperoxidase family enzyme